MKSGKIKYLKALSNVAFYIIMAFLIIWLVPKFIVFFMPFVIGWIISSIANPIVKFLEVKIKFKRKASSIVVVVLVISLVIAICYGVCYFLISQGIGFAASIPEKWPELQKEFDEVGFKINEALKSLPDGIMNSLNDLGNNLENYLGNLAGRLGSPTITFVSNFARSLPNVIISVIMCVLSAYFFTVEHNSLSDWMVKHLPKTLYSRLDEIFKGMKNAVGGYFIAQFKIEIWVYLITFIGLFIMQIDYAGIIALGIAFMDFLPFFGAGIIMVPWAVYFLIEGNIFAGIAMLVTWGIGQLVRQLIQPKMVGDQVGMDPLPTLFFLFVGFELGGMFAMIIAVPIGMILVSLYKEGLFSSFTNSVKILWTGISNFRHFSKEELSIIEPTMEEAESNEGKEEVTD